MKLLGTHRDFTFVFSSARLEEYAPTEEDFLVELLTLAG